MGFPSYDPLPVSETVTGGSIFLSEMCLFDEENVMRNLIGENDSDRSVSYCCLPNYKMSSTKSGNISKNQV